MKLPLVLLAASTFVLAESPDDDEDPFDFDQDDTLDESDSGYGQAPIGSIKATGGAKDYRGQEPGTIVFEICTS